MKIVRRKTKIIKIGDIRIGGSFPIAIQSMAKTKTADVDNTTREIKELESAGCEIVRLAIKDKLDAQAIKKIKQHCRIPIVADIHFNWQLAIEAIENGADKIRLNPGNIYKKDQIRKVVASLKSARIPLRIGVNSGSVRDLNSKNLSMADRLVESALNYAKIIEKLKFSDLVISLKASGVLDTLEAYRKISSLCEYPLHLGVTATGLPMEGIVKSSVAIGALLLEGVGDTIRVSLTDKSQEEVKVAKAILKALGLRKFGLEIISCPTCGRCEVDLIKIVKKLENKLSTQYSVLGTRPTKVAIMGCVVNGPGEARQANIAVAFGRKEGLLFKEGRAVRKVPLANCVDAILKELAKL